MLPNSVSRFVYKGCPIPFNNIMDCGVRYASQVSVA